MQWVLDQLKDAKAKTDLVIQRRAFAISNDTFRDIAHASANLESAIHRIQEKELKRVNANRT